MNSKNIVMGVTVVVLLVLGWLYYNSYNSHPAPMVSSSEPETQKGKSQSPPDPAKEDMLLILQVMGGIHLPEDPNVTAKQAYDQAVDDVKALYQNNPDETILVLGDILTDPEDDLAAEKYLAVHALSQLPAEDTLDVLKDEVEKPLPEFSEEDAENMEAQELVARKLAAIRAIGKSDPEYLLDIVGDEEAAAPLKKEAIAGYLKEAKNKSQALANLRTLLPARDQKFLAPFTQRDPNPDAAKTYFLGETKTKPIQKTK